MKLRNLFACAVASAMALVACQPEETDLGTPSIALSASEVTLSAEGGDTTLTVTATRDWTVTLDEATAEWLVVDPAAGTASADPQTVTVSALANDGYSREASVAFTIGMQTRYLTVKQDGAKGSADVLTLYENDFDLEVAQKTYGSGSSWPYLDQFEGWKNHKGSGAANVTYSFKGMSARANSTSNSNYSDYPGSGNNNMFFGASPYFAVNGIALGEATSFTLSFGTEKYSQDNGSVFKNSEFHVWLSADGAKWVELTDYVFAGGETEGRWNLAAANFSVPAGTANLSICMSVDVASSYRMDDLKLVVSTLAGPTVDFSAAVEKDFAAGNTGGNTSGGASDASAIYSNNFDKTAAVDNSGWPALESSDVWKNAAGTGIANVTYASKNVTARNNANSDGSYSDYAGSGMNNLFFGKDAPYFAVKNIALGSTTNLELTFGTEKYLKDGSSKFTNSEFHIWLSADGSKWVEFTGYTYAGTTDGRWNLATANFTVPAGTANLSICLAVDVASAYRVDDFKLAASTTAGTAVDFTAAVEKDFNAGATDGGSTGGDNGGNTTTAPESLGKKTVEEFIALADKANYYELTGTVSNFNSQYCAFDLTDETGTIYVYSVLSASKSQWTSKIANGGTVTIYGKYDYYEPKTQHEIIDAYIVSFKTAEGEEVTPDAGGNNGGGVVDGDNTSSELGWTVAENTTDKSYIEKAIVNGQDKTVIKLGTSKLIGKATFAIPEGSTKLTFYAVSWKGKPSTLNLSTGDTFTPAANEGVHDNSPYTLTVTDSDKYSVNLPAGTTNVTFETSGTDKRVLIFDAVAE